MASPFSRCRFRITTTTASNLLLPRRPRPAAFAFAAFHSTRASLLLASASASPRRRIPTTNNPTTIMAPTTPRPMIGSRGLVELRASGGKSEADLLVDELQELYDAAKDEFEIATDSTDSATIYAASDREAARDALNQLSAVYTLYTSDIDPSRTRHDPQQQQEQENQIEDLEETEQGTLITTNYDPSAIAPQVREEVKKRVGQRLRELQNAVEALEKKAHAE